MNYSNFSAKVSFWPNMHFTAIEIQQCGDLYEIYATDISRLAKSKLFVGRTHDQHLADSYAKQFEEWLPKVNREMKLREITPLARNTASSRINHQTELEILPGYLHNQRGM
ncbi:MULTISPECIES: hypothetical protein [Pantoea]|jgi:hypothetical protein|uniref:Uncharacterized protein n=1 Tax=Pantoea trifolii TaxID=2968030 RepID=A0ABT1VQY1_9GAMM|nr:MULTISPECIES: hypothetical protein [unclassified Pantoea]MCQ8229958.1 hypothetical protein [Pantoea sp. MMK2]MCQ8238673.1 hypothetical protein [Pantoea sp. MMK3]MCW6030092.1 hypothetical protein [Pantoea sp. JK]